MGRFKKLEIKGLLIENFGEMFVNSLNEIIKKSGISEEEILKKIAPKFEELLSGYEESISSLYVDKNKLNLNNFFETHFANQKKIAITYKDSFTSFILYINGCFVIYEKIVKILERKRIDSTLKTAVAIYGLIIRRADEILSLLLAGYVDGAMII